MQPAADDVDSANDDELPTNAWTTPLLSSAEAKQVRFARAWARRTLAVAGANPRAWLRALGEAGFLGQVLDRERARIRVKQLALVREGMAGICGTADSLLAVQTLVSYALTAARARPDLVEALTAGRSMAAFAITEPDGGSDLLAMKTRANREAGGYRLVGRKVLVSQGHSADWLLIFARTAEGGPRALSAFLVSAGEPGVSARELASLAPHPLSEIRLEDVRVPLEARVGAEGDGFRAALDAISRVRPSVGGAAVGMAEVALAAALQRASSRMVFGAPLAKNEAVRARLVDAASDLEAARLLVYRAAWLVDEGGIEPRVAGAPGSMAKLFATERAQGIIDAALQVFGGHGILEGTTVARLYREIRALRLYEGTSEIQRTVIARDLFSE